MKKKVKGRCTKKNQMSKWNSLTRENGDEDIEFFMIENCKTSVIILVIIILRRTREGSGRGEEEVWVVRAEEMYWFLITFKLKQRRGR